MKMLEVLDFIDKLTKYMEQSIAASDARYSNLQGMPKWVRPTRETVMASLRANKSAFPRDKDPSNSCARMLKIAMRRGWVAQGPCQSHCHAPHLWLTDLGQQALSLGKCQGCESVDHIQLTAQVYRFERKPERKYA